MPFHVSIGETLQLLGSDIGIGVLCEWIGPSSSSNLTERVLLDSDVMLWLKWLVWYKRFQGAGANVGTGIVVPFLVSVSEAFKLLGSDVVVGVLSEWISPSIDLLKTLNLLSSNIMLWLVWLIRSEGVKSARASVRGGIIMPLVVSVSNALQFFDLFSVGQRRKATVTL